MSSQAIRRLTLGCCSLTLGLLLGGPLVAQDAKDPLLEQEAQQALESQKTEKYIKETLDSAADLKEVPDSAAVVLKGFAIMSRPTRPWLPNVANRCWPRLIAASRPPTSGLQIRCPSSTIARPGCVPRRSATPRTTAFSAK